MLHQAGVIAYRVRGTKIEVVLVTSRDSGRWIIPKGNIASGLTPAEAAEQEALEEAGIKGVITSALPFGNYPYLKNLSSGKARAATVEVYLLRVKQQMKTWPEQHERKLNWVSLADAARIVQEPGMVPLFERLAELADSLLPAGRKPVPRRLAARELRGHYT
jgi:8-oxo-dGTP pyrophosphatase MutT (NUDIX family)